MQHKPAHFSLPVSHMISSVVNAVRVSTLPRFFSFPFSPGFAGMTFPMAIGIVATNKMTGYLKGAGQESLAELTGQLSGIQIYLTTMIVGFVVLNFLIMALRIERK